MTKTVLLSNRPEKKPVAALSARHPEKAHRPDKLSPRKPDWIRVRAPMGTDFAQTKKAVHARGLKTVCEEAACPNIGSCWQQRHATFMVMGEICTRACAFCNVTTGLPTPLDPDEPEKIAEAVAELGLAHVVITSVDRDDLEDGGAQHFADVISSIRLASPQTSVEILTPDFLRKPAAVEIIARARPDVFNHNLETVPRLYQAIRPGARYFTSLKLLDDVKAANPDQFTKSGLMVGLGEQREELLQVMDDLRAAGVDFLTIGQYLQPTPKHAAVKRYWSPEEFESLERVAYGKGFLMVSASPLTRSSFHAGEDFARLKVRRAAERKNS